VHVLDSDTADVVVTSGGAVEGVGQGAELAVTVAGDGDPTQTTGRQSLLLEMVRLFWGEVAAVATNDSAVAANDSADTCTDEASCQDS
jgi:hypothetical protein